MLQPEASKSQYFAEGMKYEDVFVQACQIIGAMSIMGGVFILLNRRVIGVTLCLISLLCVIATQDNPLIIEHVKPRPQAQSINFEELSRHLSFGAALVYLMIVPECSDEDMQPIHFPDPREAELNQQEKLKTA